MKLRREATRASEKEKNTRVQNGDFVGWVFLWNKIGVLFAILTFSETTVAIWFVFLEPCEGRGTNSPRTVNVNKAGPIGPVGPVFLKCS